MQLALDSVGGWQEGQLGQSTLVESNRQVTGSVEFDPAQNQYLDGEQAVVEIFSGLHGEKGHCIRFHNRDCCHGSMVAYYTCCLQETATGALTGE